MYDTIWGRAIVEKNDKFYFSCAHFNGLFRTCKSTGVSEYLGRFPEEDILETNIHWYAYGNGDEIVFLPRRGHHIHIYNIITEKIDKICVYGDGEEQHIFEDVYIDGDTIYLEEKQGNKYIVRCNMSDERVEICQKKYITGKKVVFEKIEEEFLRTIGDKSYKYACENMQWKMYDEEWMYAMEPFCSNMLLYNKKTKEVNRKNIIIKGTKFENARNELLRAFFKRYILYENDDFNLSNYLKYI